MFSVYLNGRVFVTIFFFWCLGKPVLRATVAFSG